jgi:hypothetical protein|tara:strand:- start:484 stop:1131 length:648 start_codon:yes stop_codon:yes gene_type:complete
MVISLIAVLPVYSQANSIVRYKNNIGFDVLRNGEVVGSHVTTFVHEGFELTVKSKMNLKVRLLGIPVYSFDYTSLEKWSDGELSHLDVDVKDGADQIKISSQLSKEGLTVTYPSGTYVVHGPIISTNHWNADIVKQSRVLNTLTGKINQVKLIKRGKEIIPIKDGTILATRYDYTGELTDTSVWYDSNGRWSKLEFKARDGSTVEYICNTCDAGL